MTSDITADEAAAYVADAAPSAEEADNILARITRLTAAALQAKAAVDRAEEALATAQANHRDITERQLPELMAAAQQERLVTASITHTTRSGDGTPSVAQRRYELQRGEQLRASIPPDNLEGAIMWLNANGAGSIVKNTVTLQFGKGEEQKAAEAMDLLREKGFDYENKKSVHHTTLSATLREMLEEGVNVPMQLLGAHVMPFVKIKPYNPDADRVRRPRRASR